MKSEHQWDNSIVTKTESDRWEDVERDRGILWEIELFLTFLGCDYIVVLTSSNFIKLNMSVIPQ